MVTEEDIRQVALSLPGSVEKPYNRLASFRGRSNLFLRIHELPDAFLVRCLSLGERNELLQAEPGKFFITPHYDDYPAVLVRLSQLDLDEMIELVLRYLSCGMSELPGFSTLSPAPALRTRAVIRSRRRSAR